MTIIDTAAHPGFLDEMQFISVVSALSLELATGMRYGRQSALKIAQRKGWTSVTGNATRRNLTVALAEMTYDQPSSPVFDRARQTLDEVLEQEGWELTLA
jgi:hypothetical protein